VSPTPTHSPPWCYLWRDLPESACTGDQITVSLAFYGAPECQVVTVEETVPNAWSVVSPPWDDKIDNTYIWNQLIESYEIVVGGPFLAQFSGYMTLWDDDYGYYTIDSQGDSSIWIPIDETNWLDRTLPPTCMPGDAFTVLLTQMGGTAQIILTSETLPEGWMVSEPGGYVQEDNTFTWLSCIPEYEVLVPESAEPGIYEFDGYTISTHFCPPYYTRDIGGDFTMEIPCIHNGDASQDGAVTAADAQLAFLIALGAHTPTPMQICSADCDGNGMVTAGDAQQIFLMALGSGTCADPL
jgi:hypothetical protein